MSGASEENQRTEDVRTGSIPAITGPVPVTTGPIPVGSAASPISPKANAAESVPWVLRVSAAWSWRALVLLGFVGVLVWLLGKVRTIFFAFLVALLLGLLLEPVVRFLKKRLKMGRTAAAAIGLLLGLLVLAALLAVALTQLIQQFPRMLTQSVEGMNALVDWVAEGPLPIEGESFREWLTDVQNDLLIMVRSNSSTIASGALSFASSAVSLGASALLMIFMLFFILRDGRQMWIVAVRSMPSQWRYKVNEAAIRGWVTLGSYVNTQVKVAAIDAVGIGLGAFFLGVPMAIPITVLVFLASFVPIVGAFVSGAVAVLVALVNNGVTSAVIMLLVVLAVQQIESNLLQPLMMSHAVSLHPVAVVAAVAAGGMLAGILGAVFAVPLLAFVNVTTQYLHGHDYYPYLNTDPDRPGGPRGSLGQQINASYRNRSQGNPRETKLARKVRETSSARKDKFRRK